MPLDRARKLLGTVEWWLGFGLGKWRPSQPGRVLRGGRGRSHQALSLGCFGGLGTPRGDAMPSTHGKPAARSTFTVWRVDEQAK